MQTILVVEDDSLNRQLFITILERAGYAVASVGNGSEAIEWIREYLPALVLVDIYIPGMDGFALTRLIRSDPSTAHIPIIAVTARSAPGDEARALAAGCDGYIPKPINMAILTGFLRRYLD